jgi:phenylpropionate dioxygenase-like ring-hydroxylating dioxygenase large terminal subunit
MLTKEQNWRLTSVEGDAPMARLMRENYWIPFSRIEALEAGATTPTRVRLLGEDYVAWRAPDGRVGFINQACPHRGASMALGRIEGCAIRCIFHGWLFGPSGEVLDVPTEGDRSALIAPHVPLQHYPTAEQGGLIWVWLGRKGEAPAFPDFSWLGLPDENLWITRSVWPVNWLQGMEAALDTAHVGHLHSGWARPAEALDEYSKLFRIQPRFTVDETDYGMRSAGIRTGDDGQSYVRISEFLAPFIVMTPGSLSGEKGEASLYLFVPIDDRSHLQFFGFFSQYSRLGAFFLRDRCTDPDNYVEVQGSRENNWGQDREAMDRSHYSGFVDHVLLEDAVVQASIGTIADRTKDFLTQIDIGLKTCRQLLLSQLDRFEAGEPVDGSMPAVNRDVIARGALIPADSDWREIR